MGFFAEVSAWLDGLLATFIGDKAAALAVVLEPAVITLMVVYVMGWGALMATGKIEEPLLDGFKRIARVVLILGIGLKLWLYNSLITDTFFSAPTELAAAIVGTPDPVAIVDEIIFQGSDAAAAMISKGGILDGNFAYYLAGFFIYIAVGLAAIYTIFILSLAKVALSILLALGPLFIATLLFPVSRRFFDAWIGQLANYALVAVLSVMAVSLLMQLLTRATTQAAEMGTDIDIAEAVRVCFAAVLIFLVIRQVPYVARGLASGMQLESYGTLGRSGIWLATRSASAVTRTARASAAVFRSPARSGATP
jgi:type IV secretion system protein VirB6